MIVSWFSAGVSSFVATYLLRDQIDKIIYTHIDDQHPDSLRFLRDAEKLIGKPIEILQSPYKSVDAVIIASRFINSRYGAKCTETLKKRVRKEWERGKTDLAYVWGIDGGEAHRKDGIEKAMPDQKHLFPLIENGLSKQDCHAMATRLGIARPAMYDLGYQNNNCIGCVKGGMWYWNKIRRDYPAVFALRAEREREIGHTCINGVFLDELDPARGRPEEEISQDCGIMCFINLDPS